jgi:hypothetical protein
MFRIFQSVISIPANTMYKAGSAMKTGMGVVLNPATLTASFPAAMQGTGVSIVDKERIPVGRNAGRNDMRDYDVEFTTIAEDEMVKAFNLVAMLGSFGTDQYSDAGLTIGNRVAVDTDGLWKRSTVPSIYVYEGMYDDAGNQLMKIKVADSVASNA